MTFTDENAIPLIAGTALLGILCVFIILFIIAYRKSQLNFALERKNFEEALLRSEIEIQQQTFQEIGRELHDNIGQLVSLLHLQLHSFSDDLNESDSTLKNANQQVVKQLMTEIKVLTRKVGNKKLQELGLRKMIEEDVYWLKKNHSVNFTFKYQEENNEELKEKCAIFIYRMFQESINNILKHAKATEASITYTYLTSELRLSITDNGVGFDSRTKSKPQGNGLKNLKERCAIIGAQFKLQTKVNEGTQIDIKLSL